MGFHRLITAKQSVRFTSSLSEKCRPRPVVDAALAWTEVVRVRCLGRGVVRFRLWDHRCRRLVIEPCAAIGLSYSARCDHSLWAIWAPFSATERFITSTRNATANVNTAIIQMMSK